MEEPGDGTFEDVATGVGCAYNAEGKPEASMGIVLEDLDGDTDFDLLLTHFYQETNTFYRNDGGEFFSDDTVSTGFGAFGFEDTGFGVGLIDVENDGVWELFIANGTVMRRKTRHDPNHPYAERNRLLRWSEGRFTDVSGKAGPALRLAAMSRGALFGDHDNDGDIDVCVINNRGPVHLLENQVGGGHWLSVDLVGTVSNRAAIGSVVTVTAGARTLVRASTPHTSYQSTNDRRVHFPLGSDRPDRIRVTWPTGVVEEWPAGTSDRVVRLVEGEGKSIEPGGSPPSEASTERTATSKPKFVLVKHAVPPGDELKALVLQFVADGELEEALPLARDWAQVCIKEAGYDHLQLVEALTTLAGLVAELGSKESAIQLYGNAMKGYAEHGRAEHPVIARYLTERAKLHASLQQFESAERDLREAERLCIAGLGAKHNQTAAIRALLVQHYKTTGQAAKAAELVVRRATDLGDVTPAPLEGNLWSVAAVFAQKEGRTLDAIRYYERAIPHFRVEGQEASLASTLGNLGEMYTILRDNNRALERFREAFEIQRRVGGDRAVTTLIAEARVGRALGDRGDIPEAKSRLERVLRELRALPGQELLVATTERNLGYVLVSAKEYARAVALFRAAEKTLLSEYGPEHQLILELRENIRRTERAMKNP